MTQLACHPPSISTVTTNVWTAPFWEAANRRELMVPQCANCKHFRMPPTPFCPKCHSQDLAWQKLSGKGELYSYTIVDRAIIKEMEGSIPYVPAVIELPDTDGIRLISNIIDTPLDKIRIGASVQVTWIMQPDGQHIPCFKI